MVLDPSKLNTSIKNLLTSKAETYDAAAQSWVDAYSGYAADATGLGATPVITAGAKSAMKNSLLSTFQNVNAGSPATAASSIANALTAFWFTPPIVFSVPTIVVSSVTGTAPLIAALTAVFVVVGGTEDSKAAAVSSAMDIFTKLVFVTNSVGGATGPLI